MSISAKEAAALVGLSKAAILKAIKTGKVSAAKDLAGEWRIEPVELFRVYTPVHSPSSTPVSMSPQQSAQESTVSLQRENELLRQMLGDKDEVIDDLRRRLDAATEENTRLAAVLTSQLDKPKGIARWWQRLLGG